METITATTAIIEEDSRIPFQFQIVQEHTLRAIRRITEPVNLYDTDGKFAEAQEQFERKVSN